MNSSFSIISTLIETAKLARRHARLFLTLAAIGTILPFAGQWIATGLIPAHLPDHPKPEDMPKPGTMIAGSFLSSAFAILQLIISAAMPAAILGVLKAPVTESETWPTIKASIRRYCWPLIILAFLLSIIAAVITIPFALFILAISSPQSHDQSVIPYVVAFFSMLVAILYLIFAKYALAQPLVVVENMTPLAALGRSWRMTRGRFGYVVGCYVFVGTGEYCLTVLFQNFEQPSVIGLANIADTLVNGLLSCYWIFLAWVMYKRILDAEAQPGEVIPDRAG